MINPIHEFKLDHWGHAKDDSQYDATDTIESGGVLFFPKLSFLLDPGEERFLSEHWSDGKSKNISLKGIGSNLHGVAGSPQETENLQRMVERFALQAEELVGGLFGCYRSHLRRGFTSYRPARVEGRATSWRKDDTRLHVDSFPSNPTGGDRLLRVFTNINPHGKPRVWRVGEPFPAYAAKFLPKARPPLPGYAWLLEKSGITKSYRTQYDHYMGQLHDLGKADMDYQQTSPQVTFNFPPGSTWVVFSDQVLHAVMAGQFMLEQTFYLAPEHLRNPQKGPLGVLEKLTGHPLRPSNP